MPQSRSTDPLVTAIRRALAAAADPAKAPAMQRYMKSSLPFLGVQAPVRRRLVRERLAERPPADGDAWRSALLALWREAAFREERYAALDLAADRRARAWRDASCLPLWDELVRTGAWWDLVDPVATGLLGELLLRHPEAARPALLSWTRDHDRWRRRAAVICQVKARQRTDLELLRAAIEANAADPDFFLRKGIGWALRSYAWVDPAWVQGYVDELAGRLSPLSRREALRNIGPGN